MERNWFLDPPRGEEYWTASSDEFQHATDLIKYIRTHHGQEFCIGVAGKSSPSLLTLSKGGGSES